MTRGSIFKALSATFAAAVIAVAEIPVEAGTTGNGIPKAFPSKASAQQSCPTDVVVWATKDVSHRLFYKMGSPSYAKVEGYYACMKDAEFHKFVAG